MENIPKKYDDPDPLHDEFYNGQTSHCCGGKEADEKSKLRRIHDMPEYLQFNQYVHSGYRDEQDGWGCLLSIFYLHNETINVLTHLTPILGVAFCWRMMYPWDEIQDNIYFRILGCLHVLASISPWFGSVTYHLFMNHRKGLEVYQFLLQIDMLGIWLAQCSGSLTNLVAATWCLPNHIQTICLTIYATVSIWGLYMATTAASPLARRMCFAPVFISRILGFILRISPAGGGEPNILLHIILQDLISVLGAMIGVTRIPEKWFPGKLDIFCNSHHIMHVMVVAAMFHMNWASNGDVHWMLKNYHARGQCGTL